MAPQITRVRRLTTEEREALKGGLRSSSAVTVRRCQILLTSADEGLKPGDIGKRLHCSDQCVRNTLHAFEREGIGCIEEKSHRPHTVKSHFTQAGLERLSELVHHSPREYGYATGRWSLERLAEVSAAQKITTGKVSYEAVRRALKRLGLNWRQARKRLTSSDEHYELKKNSEMR